MMFDEAYGTMFREDIPYEEIKPDYKKEYWEIGFGLQKIDGLEPSKYLVELAEKQVAGEITYAELIESLTDYHDKTNNPNESEEADFTSARIAEILAEDGFSLRPSVLVNYHKRIFSGLKTFHHPVGKYRTVDMGKKEAVLDGDSVRYENASDIQTTLEHDFALEQKKRYRGVDDEEVAHQVMTFISNIWQVHPFCDGNVIQEYKAKVA